jgi:hypothetical protein
VARGAAAAFGVRRFIAAFRAFCGRGETPRKAAMNRRTPKMLGVVTEWLFMDDALHTFIPITPEYNKTQTHCKLFFPTGNSFRHFPGAGVA